jgi:hypothetical protein
VESANEMVDLLTSRFDTDPVVKIDDVLKRLTFDIIGMFQYLQISVDL